ncbi:hypothetical protein F4775DRAFT_373131 [Biscogniauxia sp. FL1348]|nr:hypothetical protein F4775DRAFT_373131 [Biscogniauxia sp. FL1348]
MSDELTSIPEVEVEVEVEVGSIEAVDNPHCPPSSPSDPRRPSEDLGGIDGLVRRMSRQTLIPQTTTITTTATTTTDSTLNPSVPLEHHRQQGTPLLNTSSDRSNDTPGGQVVHDHAANDLPHVAASGTNILRRQTVPLHYNSISSLRSLDLVTDMIENSLQCNVRNSTPSPAPQPANTAFGSPIEPRNGPDEDMLDDDMNLEVDLGYREQDDTSLLDDTNVLRHASESGFLRYRSSTELASSCRILKRSVPRMRRRRRNKSPKSPPMPPKSRGLYE